MECYPSGLSIVIPTEGRPTLTARLLQGIAAARQTVAVPVEVLLIDSSDGQSRLTIQDACLSTGAVYLRGSANVREKRNQGLSRCQYSVVLFLDSDCLPDLTLLVNHWKHYPAPDANLGGVVGQTIFEGPEGLAWRMVSRTSLVAHFTQAANQNALAWGTTSNISFRHEVLDEVGPFDTDFPFRLGGDDLDLSYRVSQSGYMLRAEPDAIVLHSRSTWNTVPSVLRRALRWGRIEYYLYRKHPSARVWCPPDLFGWLLLVAVLFASQALLFGSLLYLSLIPIWFTLALMLFTILASREATAGSPAHRLGHHVLSSIPELTYRFGVAIEFLFHGDFRFMWSRAWFEPRAPQNNWRFEAWNLWSNLSALLACQGLLLLGGVR